MQLRRAFFLGVGALVGFNLILSFGSIFLLVRMSPAVDRILRENVASNEAAERIVSVLVEVAAGRDAADARRDFDDALLRAREKVTEPEETPVLDRIEASAPDAFAGDAQALRAIVDSVDEFIGINREAMRAADARAQRLGSAGAWAAVIVAVFSFVSSLFVIRALEKRVLHPLEELHAVLEAARAGDRHRRCGAVAGSEEIRRVFGGVNALLDRLLPAADESRDAETQARSAAARDALVGVLERDEGPAVIVGRDGEVVAANDRALERLAASSGDALRARLRDVADGEEETGDGWGRDALPGDRGVVVRFPAEPEAAEEEPKASEGEADSAGGSA